MLFLSDFNETNFLNRFSKNTQLQNFRKILLAEPESYFAEGGTDGQTDRLDEANRRFTQFCELVYKCKYFLVYLQH